MNIYWSLLLATVMFVTGWKVQEWHMDDEIQAVKLQQASDRANVAEKALGDLQDGIKTMRTAATDLAGIKLNLSGKLDTISKDLKNAQAKNPLPADCRPDDIRLQHLKAAVDATNNAAVGQ